MQIYGSDSERADKLRSGEGGRLKGNAEKGEDALMPFADVRRCPDAQVGADEETLRVSRIGQSRGFVACLLQAKGAGVIDGYSNFCWSNFEHPCTQQPDAAPHWTCVVFTCGSRSTSCIFFHL